MKRRVVVTGLGVLAPGGNGVGQFFETLISGTTAITRIDTDFSGKLALPYAGQIHFNPEEHFQLQQLRCMDRVSQLALIAAREALSDAALALNDQAKQSLGIYLGTGMGGAMTLDDGYDSLYRAGAARLPPFTVLMVMNNAPAAWIAEEYGFAGPNLTFSTACSSSAVAIGEAARLIRDGQCEVMLAGGTEAPLSYGQMKAWESLRTLAVVDPKNPAGSCKPFAKNRSGLVLGEGAGIVVLESEEHARQRNAKIYAAILGYATTTDVTHITRPTQAGQSRTMRAALTDAGLALDAIDYINAHGTGTAQNDAVETAAMKEVFGDYAYRIPISSTKATHGHLLGAAGAVEFVACIKAMREGVLPPTLHLHEPDPYCDLDYVANAARPDQPIRTMMSNSFAFGGTNAVLIAGVFA